MKKSSVFLIIAVCLGLISGYFHHATINYLAQGVADLFINLLKLVSLPIIFLSVVSTSSGMQDARELRTLGQKVAKYTILTTLLAASVALILFVTIDPVRTEIQSTHEAITETATQQDYFKYLQQIVPSNIVKPFVENNVISVLFMALLFSLSIIALPEENRKTLHLFFSSVYAAIMKLTHWIVNLMPIAIWAFITLFMKDLYEGLEIESLALYLLTVVSANLVQGFLILPLLLKLKGISPVRVARGMLPALSVAFFTKSSNAALPMAMKCAEERVGVSRRVSSFSFPLCTTINMNGCAAFILITVLFVSMNNGVHFTPFEMILWIFLSTIAAVGNAGVPMGCYFLSSAFLAAMNVPLNILGVILPFYALIDMLETAINIWSDSCVATLVDHELSPESLATNQ